MPVKEFVMDLRPFGVESKPMRQWMLIRRVEGGERKGLESKL